MVYDWQLTSFHYQGQDYQNLDGIDAAERSRAQGDAFFTSGQYRRASKKYNQAKEYISRKLPERYDSTDEEIEEADKESRSHVEIPISCGNLTWSMWKKLTKNPPVHCREDTFNNSESHVENDVQDENNFSLYDDVDDYIATEEINIGCDDPNEDLPSEEEYDSYWVRDGPARVPGAVSVRSVSEGRDTDPDRQAKYQQFKELIVFCNLRNSQCQMQLENYIEAAHLCTEVLIIDSKNCEASDLRSQAYSLLLDDGLTELDINNMLEELGLKHASENNLQRRLVLLKEYQIYRLSGSKTLMNGDMAGEKYGTEGSGDTDEEYSEFNNFYYGGEFSNR